MIGDLIQQLTTNIVVGGLAIFALSLGFFAIHYLNRRRQMLHQERMAALIKGLHYAGVARDVLVKPKPDSRDHMLSGLRWLFGAGAASGAMYGYESLQPVVDAGAAMQGALVGIIPGAIGLAHLLFSWLCSRRTSTGVAAPGRPYYRTAYRPAVRRY
jgi:hypothetical protein